MKEAKPLNKKALAIIISIVLALAVVVTVVSTTVAYYIKRSNDSSGTYDPAVSKTPNILNFTVDKQNNTLKDIKFNVGETDYPVFVRVSIVVTWQKVVNKTGNDGKDTEESRIVHITKPTKDTDYSLTLNDAAKDNIWVAVGSNYGSSSDFYGYYYYTKPVLSGKDTEVFIKEFKLLEKATAPEEDYFLNIEISIQTIQAIGSTDNGNIPAWKDAGWAELKDGWVLE